MSISGEIKSHIRDINLTMLMSNHKIDIDPSKRYSNRIRLFMPNRRLINYINKMGGVLTGSRAIKCYTINGNTILDRKTNDWDFVITKSMAYKICNDFKIEYNLVNTVISIEKCRWHAHPAYGDSYRLGIVDVHLIIKDELPDYIEKNGVRIANLSYSISEKVKSMDELNNTISRNPSHFKEEKEELSKHMDDLTQLIIKFNCIE